jgi:class 3 adenylate cyclase
METEVINKDSPVYRYLPTTLLSNWAASPNQDPVWGEWLHGSLMHCDVTGFTAMNEALASMGNEGAEVMAKILNQFFERMLRIGENWNGIQMKFGGDAMLLYFPNEQHALCAAKCGLEMQAAMKGFSKVQINDGVCQLRMRIGIHSGRFYSASLGHEKGLLHYLMTGPDVNRAADVEPLAEPGQVVVSEETAQFLKGHSRLSQTEHEGIWEVKHVVPLDIAILNPDVSGAPQDILKRYLMPAIASNKASGIDGEHRRATISFIYLFGLSELLNEAGEKEALNQANEYIQMVMSIAEKYGGSLLASDVAEHADKIVVSFGAPVSIADQEGNCLRFAHELKEMVAQSDLDLRHQIGINTGFLFAGEIGSSWRREYTTIGDNMNLAARLMAAAGEGNILVSAATVEKVGDEFEFDVLEPIRVKGKSQPIKISRLISITDNHKNTAQLKDAVFLGRNDELDKLINLTKQSAHGRTVSAFISGDPGMGKASLCEALLSRLQSDGWQTAQSICQSYNSHSVFSAWKYPLLKLFGVSNADSPQKVWSAIKDGVLRYCPDMEEFSPLVADMLAVAHESNAVVNSLDTKIKQEKRLALVKALLANMSKENPICLVFYSVKWMDPSSLELVKEVLNQKNEKLCIILAVRNQDIPENLFNKKPDLAIHLQPFSEEKSRELILSMSDLDEELVQKVIKKSGGNPLFIKELIRSNLSSDRELPNSIYDIVMVKLDGLRGEERLALRNSAVIGQVFDVNILASVCKSM